ncbi:unnamed protein product [Adineta ricciae]|uniref:Uncharacterized protein n=1 Tax=Adineta ricciae TaxID=249248 RepID=A0A816EDL8_ADIRI|nr:unnamed protein product [Adineta ricciae]
MSFEMTDLNRIKIAKDGGEYIDLRFHADASVVDIDFTLRNILNIPNDAKYSIVYQDQISGRDVYIMGSGPMFRECLEEKITELDIRIAPKTPVKAPTPSSGSNSDKANGTVQQWPNLMNGIDRRIQRWTNHSGYHIYVASLRGQFPGYYGTVGSGRLVISRPESGGKEPAGIEKSCTGTDSDFNGSSRRNDGPENAFISFAFDIRSGKTVANSSPTVLTNTTSIEILLKNIINFMNTTVSSDNSTPST